MLFRSHEAKFAEICDKKISENFACDKPNEKIKFQIINIDYLTAEDYAEEFHCLKSATRSAFVKKVNFMPGFTAKTGGLILDEPFIANARKNFSKTTCDKKISQTRGDLSQICENLSQMSQKILIFSYRKNFSPIIRAFSKICDKNLSRSEEHTSELQSR